MKEKQFLKELKELGFENGIQMEVYFGFDEKGNIILDEESLNEGFETRMKELRGILDNSNNLNWIDKAEEEQRINNEEREEFWKTH